MEQFDHLKTKGMRHTEHHCCQFNTGLVQFYPKINLWHKHCTLWSLVLHRKAGFLVKAKLIHWLAIACPVLNPLSFSKEQATLEFLAAQEKYNQLTPKHDLLCQEFLQLCFHNSTLSEEHHKVTARLVSLESLRNSYWHICAL